MSTAPPIPPETFLPTLRVGDALAAHWLRSVTLRLRREVAWLWRERGMAPSDNSTSPEALPPIAERLESALDLSRHDGEKRRFLAQDETAAYLSHLIAKPAPSDQGPAVPGSFTWVARELKLSDLECFLLALALSPVVDSAAGPVYAACLNDATRQTPTLALAQRLWDRPAEILALANPAHPLLTHGLVSSALGGTTQLWDAPLGMPTMVAEALLRTRSGELPPPLVALSPEAETLPLEVDVAVARLRSQDRAGVRWAPIVGSRGMALGGVAAALGERIGMRVAATTSTMVGPGADVWLATTLTLAWLHGVALYIEIDRWATAPSPDGHGSPAVSLPLAGVPVTVFVGMTDRGQLKRLPTGHTLPPVHVRPSTYRQRLEWWRDHAPGGRRDVELDATLSDCARRFRHEKGTILGICRDLHSLGRPLRAIDLTQACRADVDLGDLAQPVVPRFSEADLMLPPKQTRQLQEIIRAMRMLTTVHYDWGTEQVWNESGLSALFAGPPGTGKTMAAEVIAHELGLPLTRIDLSQVVNKYIGETEKNLRRLFDAAEASDVILFFDEADSLFGKRTEVKDAHDRYANLEVSYLLERMERFKGLAILATNRKKDLDEAFLRRLRFLIDFPLPGVDERLRIWRQAIPPGVDSEAIDFPFLAQRFPVAGGHIRSIVFQACLQTAQPSGPRRLTMESIVAAVKREYDKLDRAVSLEKYGIYASIAQDPS